MGEPTNDKSFLEKFYGKTISSCDINNESLLSFKFDDGSFLTISDEYLGSGGRYMNTDDNLSDLVGGLLLGIVVEEGDTKERGICDYVEEEFLKISTSSGFATVVNYNQHNGYYGGFDIRFNGEVK